jgi:hypothetical protein
LSLPDMTARSARRKHVRMWAGKLDAVRFGVVVAIASAGGLLLFYLNETLQRRIVPDGPGALMAIDADGLRELHLLYVYASPKICGDAHYRRSTDFMTVHELCDRAVPITPETVKKGLVLLRGGTRAVSLHLGYILAGGHLAVRFF